MSANLTVAFTLQRFFSICFPFKKNIMEDHCKHIITGLLAFSCTFYNYAIWGYNSECQHEDYVTIDDSIRYCKARKRFENLVDMLDLLEGVFTFIIPFLSIAIMNKIIVKKIDQSKKALIVCSYSNINYNTNKTPSYHKSYSNLRNNPEAKYLSDESNQLDYGTSSGQNDKKIEKIDQFPIMKKNVIFHHISVNSKDLHPNAECVSFKVIKMLVCVSTVFLLLNAPYYFFKIYVYVRISITKNEAYSSNERCILEILKLIFYMSFSVNFFLYSISGSAFRKEIKNFAQNCFKRAS